MRIRILTLVAGTLTLFAAITHAEDKTKVLLLGKEVDHPYGTHMYMFECELLAKCLRQTPGVEAVVSKGWPKDPGVLEGVDAVVTYSAEGGTELLGGKRRAEFEKLMKGGAGLVALHWSTGAATNEIGPRWRDTLGGWFSLEFSRLNVTEAVARKAKPDHPISRGWSDFPLRDEYYLGLRFDEKMVPIVVAKVEEKDYPVGWAFERPDGGKSFGFVCGHFHDVFLNDSYRRIAVNAILWSAGREVPADGAPCSITSAEGTLPPEGSK